MKQIIAILSGLISIIAAAFFLGKRESKKERAVEDFQNMIKTTEKVNEVKKDIATLSRDDKRKRLQKPTAKN